MCGGSHCRCTDNSEVFFRIKLRGGLSDCVKAVLEKLRAIVSEPMAFDILSRPLQPQF